MKDNIVAYDLRDGIFLIRQIPPANLMEIGISRLLTDYSIPSILMISDNSKY